jgi:hypothetical protein
MAFFRYLPLLYNFAMRRQQAIRNFAGLFASILILATLSYQSAVAVTGTVSGVVNENGTLTLTAPGGTAFTSVEFASYGTPNSGSTPYSLGACHASNSSTIVGTAFIGLNSASINANNAVFGDPCNGTGKRLAVTLNYASTSSPSSFNSLGLSGGGTTAVYRSATTISAEVSVASKVTFKAGGTVISGCKNRATSGSSPFTVSCSWKPSRHGSYQITATANPNSNSYTASSATPLQVMVTRKAAPRFVFPAFAYGSVAFTTSTYLMMSPGISPGAQPFTIELWLKTGSTVKGGSILGNSANSGALSFILDNATTMHTDGFNQSATNFTLPVTLQPNTWYHIALVRDGSNNETVWIDGVRSTSGQQTDSRNYYSNATGINWAHCTWCVAGSSKFDGERVTNLRVLVGTALYNTASTTITVPTPPLTTIANTKLLLLATSAGTMTVDTSGNQTITNNGATFATGQ